MPQALAGARIVIARARGRGESLAWRIAAAGGEAFELPVIEIAALAATLPGGAPDWLVFTSVAAVEHGLPQVAPRRLPSTRVAAIGEATAAALEGAGLRVDLTPQRQESEGLLERAEFERVAGQRIWIVRGRGGRELLARALGERGALVAHIETYERRLPASDVAPLLERWRRGRVDAIVVNSATGLANLHALLDAEGRDFLGETQLVVPTARMLKLAHEIDIRVAPIVATGASDDALLTALVNWWRDGRRESR